MVMNVEDCSGHGYELIMEIVDNPPDGSVEFTQLVGNYTEDQINQVELAEEFDD